MGQPVTLPSENVVSGWFEFNNKLNAHEWENDVLKEASSGFLYSKYSVYKKYTPYSNRIMKDAQLPNCKRTLSL